VGCLAPARGAILGGCEYFKMWGLRVEVTGGQDFEGDIWSLAPPLSFLSVHHEVKKTVHDTCPPP
jgi:hypothetical protein